MKSDFDMKHIENYTNIIIDYAESNNLLVWQVMPYVFGALTAIYADVNDFDDIIKSDYSHHTGKIAEILNNAYMRKIEKNIRKKGVKT
jgi:hypothetical protein